MPGRHPRLGGRDARSRTSARTARRSSATITEVVAYDRRDAARRSPLPNAECAFSYRHSRFKADPDRYVVLRVRFELEDAGGLSAPIKYAETARALGVEPGDRVPAGRPPARPS